MEYVFIYLVSNFFLTMSTKSARLLAKSSSTYQFHLLQIEETRESLSYKVKILRGQMETILDVINEAIENAQKLHDKLDHKR